MKKLAIVVIFLFCSCVGRVSENRIVIKLSDSNHSIHISGFDRAIINDIARDTDTNVWQGLLPVYKMPVDTDDKDFLTAQPGKYKVVDSLVIFTPDTAFKKGQSYFLRCFKFDDRQSVWQLVGARKKLGNLRYTDLQFSY